MMRRQARPIALGALLLTSCVLFSALCLVLVGRGLFNEPGVARLDSVRDGLGTERMLFVLAHPDDEITSNALMRRAVGEGVNVALFTATRGEAGTQFPPVVDQAHLGVVREAEARRHGFDLGVDRHVVDDLGDGQLIHRPFEILVQRVLDEIQTTGADTVISFHPDTAISLHDDHRTIGAAAREAVARSGRDIRLVFVLAPRPALRRFGGETGRIIADGQPEPDFAVAAPAADKQRAWRIHQSQSGYLQAAYGLSPGLLYALWTEEYFAFADREDSNALANDLTFN